MTDVQPDGAAVEGQGQGSEGGLFDTYLQAVPDDAREYVTGYLKDAERNVNSRLSAAADIEKRFGPYQEIDFSGYDPKQLKDVLDWHQSVTQSEDAFKQWLTEAAKEAGIGAEEEPEEDFGGLTPQQLQALVQQQTAPLAQQFQQFQQQQQEQQELANLEQSIETSFAGIEQKHGIQLSDEQKAAIVDLGESHEGDDWVDVGFSRFQTLTGGAQADLVNRKLGQPKPSLSGGGQEAPPNPQTLKEIEEMARERFRQAHST